MEAGRLPILYLRRRKKTCPAINVRQFIEYPSENGADRAAVVPMRIAGHAPGARGLGLVVP